MINITPLISNKKHILPALLIVAILISGCLAQSPELKCDYTITVEKFNKQGYGTDEVLEDIKNGIIVETEENGEKAYCIKFGKKQENEKTVAKPEVYDEGNNYIPHHKWDEVIIKANSDDEKRAFNDLLDDFEITDEYGRKKFLEESDGKTLLEIEKNAKEYHRDLEKFEKNFKEYVDAGLDYELAREQMYVDFGRALDTSEKEVIAKIMKFSDASHQTEMYKIYNENQGKFNFLSLSPEAAVVFFDQNDEIADNYINELLEMKANETEVNENIKKGLFNGAARDGEITDEDLDEAKYIVKIVYKDDYVINLMIEDTSVEKPIVYLKIENPNTEAETKQIIVDKGKAEVVEIVPAKKEVLSTCKVKDKIYTCAHSSKYLKKTKGNIQGAYSFDDNGVNLITYSKNGIEEKFYKWHKVEPYPKNATAKEVSLSFINGRRIKIDGEFINMTYIFSSKAIYPDNTYITSGSYIDTNGDGKPDVSVNYGGLGEARNYSYTLIGWRDYKNKLESYVIEISDGYKKSEMEKFKDSENIYERIMYWIYIKGILEDFQEENPPPSII